MPLSNYGELKTSVANWIHRSDLDAEIPDFIAMARSRICHDLESVHLDYRFPATLTTEYYTLPSDLIDIRMVKIGGRRLSFYTEEQIVKNGFDEASGNEAIYTIIGNEIRIIGTPDNAAFELIYKRLPAAMSADLDADVILSNYPQLYIYASMIEFYLFAEDDIHADKVAKYYSDAITQINDKSSRARYPAGQIAVRAV